MILVAVLAVVLSSSPVRVAAGARANLFACGWIWAKGAPARVILMQGAPPQNGACTYARRLAVRCVRTGRAPSLWRCRRHPYPNRKILAVIERKNPLKSVLVDRGGPIGE